MFSKKSVDLCYHYATRTLVVHAAAHAGRDPNRVSFVATLRIARLRVEAESLRNDPDAGDASRIKAPKDPIGHEQVGARFVVVVQSDDLPLTTWIVAPTSTGRREVSFCLEVQINGEKTKVLVKQLSAVDPHTRLGEFVGRLDSSEMLAVDTAFLAMLGLD